GGDAARGLAIRVLLEGPLGMLPPLGGLDAARTRAFTDELTTLLDAPLAPPVPNDESTRRTTP
ncbi:MarR family transcriptional regulator, partial [Streptomyces anthocyanicus]